MKVGDKMRSLRTKICWPWTLDDETDDEGRKVVRDALDFPIRRFDGPKAEQRALDYIHLAAALVHLDEDWPRG